MWRVMITRVKTILILLPVLIGSLACGASGTAPNVASANGAASEPAPASDGAQPASAEESPQSSALPKDLGTINGKPATFRHAFLTMTEGPGSMEVQAFTYEQVDESEVCPNGLRFISEGAMLQVTLLDKRELSDTGQFLVQTDKPQVKVTKASAKLRGEPKPGSKVPLEVHLEGSNGTQLDGTIDVIVCRPPQSE